MGTLVRLGLLAGVGGALYSYFRGRNQHGNSTWSTNEGTAPVHSSGIVRDSGPAAQRDPAKRAWDKVDEQSDQSFPASDSPGTY